MTDDAKYRDAKEYAREIAFERPALLWTLGVIVALFAAGFCAGLLYR